MNYSDYRSVARENLRGNWSLSVFVAAIAWLLGGILVGSTFIPQINFKYQGESISLDEWMALATTISHTLGSGLMKLNLLKLAQLVIGGVIQLGYAQYLLKQHNHASFELHDLFSQFDRFKEGFLQKFLRSLYTVLWSLLFVIPGIVKSYAYAMTPFIMAENPDMSANDAIKASIRLMEGHKGELFTLDLTFIGWDLLAALTCNIGYLFLNPYKNAAYAAFYKDLTASK